MAQKWEVPLTLLQGIDLIAPQLSFDFGGSALKILKLCPETSRNPGKVQVEIITFQLNKFDEALKWMKEVLENRNLDNPITLHCTGYEANKKALVIQEELNVKLSLHDELESICRATQSLFATMPRHLCVDDPSAESQRLVGEAITAMTNVAQAYDGSSAVQFPLCDSSLKPSFWLSEPLTCSEVLPYDQSCEDLYPLLLVIAGSAASLLKLTGATTDPVFVEFTSRAGKAFLGLGNLCCGTSDFSELISLAERGVGGAVHTTFSGMTGTSEVGHDSYNALQTAGADSIAYSWGGVIGKSTESLRREDMARGILQYVCHDLASLVFLTAVRVGVSRVVMTGGFVDHPLVKFEFARWFGLNRMNSTKHSVRLEFAQHGGHLGCLGSLLKQRTMTS